MCRRDINCYEKNVVSRNVIADVVSVTTPRLLIVDSTPVVSLVSAFF
jgi:hypothetical protein